MVRENKIFETFQHAPSASSLLYQVCTCVRETEHRHGGGGAEWGAPTTEESLGMGNEA